VLRILAVCGLRPGEALALRIDDFEGNQLRIDEALKERQLGEARFGDTKTDESDSYGPYLRISAARLRNGSQFIRNATIRGRFSFSIEGEQHSASATI
jgi:integrase